MKLNLKYILCLNLLLFTFFLSGSIYAQDLKMQLKGQVTDESGSPLCDVQIWNSEGVLVYATDVFGQFKIKELADEELTFMKSGYQLVAIQKDEQSWAVTMKKDISHKDRMLDYGFQVKRRQGIAGEAVSVIEGRDLEYIASANLSQILEGQMLGLGTLEEQSDVANEKVIKNVRGIATINGTEPLVVIDGVVMHDYNVNYLTAAEIENIVLLKDAAATAIWGLQGANGVLVINTKRALPGKFDVKLTTDFSIQQISRKPERYSSYDYASMRNQAWRNDGGVGQIPFSDEVLAQYADGSNPLYPNVDYYNEFVRKMGTMERVGITMSGGNERTKAWSNINIMNQTSLFKRQTDAYVATPRRFWVNFRANVDVNISKHVRAFASVAGNVRNDRLASDGKDNMFIYNTIFTQPSTMIGPVTEDGRVTTMENVPIPTYGLLNRSGYTKYSGMSISTHAGVHVDLDFITRGLSFTGKVIFQSSNDRYNFSTQNFRRFYYDYNLGDFRQLGADIDTNLTNGVDGKYQYGLSFAGQIDYARTFGKHDFDAHLYTYYTESQYNKVVADFPAYGLPYFRQNSGLNMHYNYDDRYSVGVTLGLTASDVFSSSNRFNFLPAFSVAWIASNESFLKDSKWLTYLKLRASYGESLSDDFSVGYYRYLYTDYVGKDGNIRLVGNKDLRPEKHKIQNYGLDLGLWNKLHLTVDYFHNRTDNMLINSANGIPSWHGVHPDCMMRVNHGAMKNSGVELGAQFETQFGRDWALRLGAKYAHTENKILSIKEKSLNGISSDLSEYAYGFRQEGFPVGQQFGYLIDGYISTDEQLDFYKNRYEIGVPRKGDFIYRDLNGDGFINQKDMAPIGKGSVPTDLASINLGFGWKGFDVDMMFQGVMGYYGTMDYQTELVANSIYNDLHRKAWTEQRYEQGGAIEAPAVSYNSKSISMLPNNFNIAKRSFWRLKTMSVSYTFNSQGLRRAGIERLKIVLSGQNLFTCSKLKSKVIDPETGSMTKIPVMRVINLGIKLDF